MEQQATDTIGPLEDRLPENVLERRTTLPLRVQPVTLEGRYIRMVPLDLDRDAEALYAVSNGQPVRLGDKAIGPYDPDEIIWRFLFAGPFDTVDDFIDYLRPQVDAPNGLCFCVNDLATNQPVGVLNYMNNSPENLKIELGSIWYSPLVQRTPANTEATYLTLRHAFDLGYRRLEWKCNALNERSRRAALRMGFSFEGIQDAHMIVKDRSRDTAWFRILDHEWPEVQERLEARLAPRG